ncbi:hypothetical protein ABIA00_003369 [Bradyrhizobium ottawaense]|uniref:hypothetical protein n=1 Tax=Bradyrhizobium ottawaense TaxID=931866 RepID=UPI003833D1EF
MRLIRLILFDLALILLASGVAKAMNVAAGTTPLVPGQPPDNPGRDELADNSAGMEPSFGCVIRESRRPISYIFDRTERLNIPPRLRSICNPTASPLSLLPAGSGMVIMAFATILLVIVVIVVEIFGPV